MIEKSINVHSQVLAFFLLAFGVTFSGGLLAGKIGHSQEKVIRGLYHAYLTSRLFCNEKETSRYFTKDLTHLLIRPCKLGLYWPELELSDPLVTGQDWDSDTVLQTLRIEPAPGSNATYKAHFRILEGVDPTTVIYYLRKQNGEWRIFDVHGDYMLRGELSRALRPHSAE